MTHLQEFLLLASRRSDILLVSLLVSIVFMIILPLPLVLVDCLIALNLAITGLILIVAIYLTSPLEFSTFPSILLITTLFRLALSITTTRLILLEADAGQIVYTFGNFVIGGNIVVGIVVFLIITIMQFIVITKGAERVAEVSARFSLDAMPGKQMSIDGDLRAGTIDMNEAKKRRTTVEKESQLYGAMDGAMKFVKGDSIAGIIIIAVNIIGGISVGVFQHGMSMADALQLYTILTVGDGLIQQIPSLFIAITSGIVVTRVSGESQNASNLGDDIVHQLTNRFEVILGTGVICMIFAVVPGMPTWIFMGFAVLLGSLGYYKYYQHQSTIKQVSTVGIGDKDDAQTLKNELMTSSELSFSIPLILEISTSLKDFINDEILSAELVKLRNRLYSELGMLFPTVYMRFNPSIKSNCYNIQIYEIPVTQGYIEPDYLLATETPSALEIFNVPTVIKSKFLPGIETILVHKQYQDILDCTKVNYFNPNQIILYHIDSVLKQHASEFVGIQDVKNFLDKLESSVPEITKEIQRALSLQKITEILKRLVSENISIRNLKFIFSVLIDWSNKEKDTVLLTEYVRGALKRQITYQYSSNNILPAYLLDNGVEDTIRSAIRHTTSGSYLALDQTITHSLIENLRRYAGGLHKKNQRSVLLVSMDVRRYVRKLIENDFYNLPVLSYQELTSDVVVQPLSYISVNK